MAALLAKQTAASEDLVRRAQAAAKALQAPAAHAAQPATVDEPYAKKGGRSDGRSGPSKRQIKSQALVEGVKKRRTDQDLNEWQRKKW